MKSAIQREGQAQRRVEDWVTDKEDLVSEIRSIQTTNTWLDYQIQKYSNYIKRLNREIELLNTKKLEARKVREGLEPYLENEVLVRLKTYIASDLPFYETVRVQGVEDAKSTMNDPHSSLAEKLRQVLSILEIEADYGKEVGTSDVTLIIDGRETEVTVLRFGRVSMFYISLDGKKTGWWNHQTRVWEALPKRFVHEINRALQMAKRERTIDLIHIPVGAVK
jgi:DNA polymerase II small subunit/DNA polymerase delta subunit B